MAILERLKILYPHDYESVYEEMIQLISKWQKLSFPHYGDISEKDVCLIAYGDSINLPGEKPLASLNRFYRNYLTGLINTIHILPMYPYSSDDGFSVIDFRKINPLFGDWNDMSKLQDAAFLMFDAVINHVSVESDYFQAFLAEKVPFQNFFITMVPGTDLSSVTRPRTSPLLTPFPSKSGIKHVWTTFSADQVDLNFREPKVLLEILDVLLFYIHHGARFIRFDAVGFIWKELGTTCMHLQEAHEIVKLMREIIDEVASGVKIITETNVKHAENIAYFGNGSDEASLVYQFPLPPLVLYSFLKQDATDLSKWLYELPETEKGTTFFNFLSSHDGIGLRPLEGLLPDTEIKTMISQLKERGARINYRKTSSGEEIPYECCITYMDALSGLEESDATRAKRMLGAHLILLSLQGLPAIYYHSLLGSRNDYLGADQSQINRRISREKLDYSRLVNELNEPENLRNLVFSGLSEMIQVRKSNPLFHPECPQKVHFIDQRLFCLERYLNDNSLLACVNLSGENVSVPLDGKYRNLITQEDFESYLILEPYAYGWYQKKQNG